MSEIAIGIDLGTYNSAVAYAASAEQVYVLPATWGSTPQGDVVPSFLRFDLRGELCAFGQEARRVERGGSRQVVWGFKRLIGRSYRETAADRKRFLYRIAQRSDGGIAIPLGDRDYTPADMARLLLSRIKQDVESNLHPQLRGAVRRAVITHPAYFESEMILQTRQAALDAGFAEVELIPEPIAAALAYGQRLDLTSRPLIMAIDWGAGTLDIVLMGSTDEQDRRRLTPAHPASGHTQLGGIDMDDALLKAVVAAYGLDDAVIGRLVDGRPLATETDAQQLDEALRLREAVERAKITLSTLPTATEDAPYRGRSLRIHLARTRADVPPQGGPWVVLDEALAPLLANFRAQLEWALRDAHVKPAEIDHVLLVGGPMHMPCVRQVIADVMAGNERVCAALAQIDAQGFAVDPMTTVARGAALYASGLVDLPGVQLPFDYGLGYQIGEAACRGAIMLRRGLNAPSTSKPLVLTMRGAPGRPAPIALLVREDGPQGRLRLVSSYLFYPAVDGEGRASVAAWLSADADGVVSATVVDLVLHTAPLHLTGIGQLSGEPMDTLEDIPAYEERADVPLDVDGTDEFWQTPMGEEVRRLLAEDAARSQPAAPRAPRPPRPVPADQVEAVRAAAELLIALTDGPWRDAVRINRSHELHGAIDRLRDTLAELPDGDAQHTVFAGAAHALQEALLQSARAGLLPPDEHHRIQAFLRTAHLRADDGLE